jgi:hypothetical protein
MIPYELNNDNLYLSKKNAGYALYSGQIFIIVFIVSVYLKYYYLSIASFFLYLSTMFFWSNVHTTNSFEMKLIDCATAAIVIYLVVFYYAETHVKPKYKNVIQTVCLYAVLVFLLNELVYYYTVKTHNDYTRILNIHRREFVNEITMISHVTFVHLLPSFTFMYCALASI